MSAFACLVESIVRNEGLCTFVGRLRAVIRSLFNIKFTI